MHNGLVDDVTKEMLEPVLSRITKTEKLIDGIKNKYTFEYVNVLLGLKYDYEFASKFEEADEVAKELIDIVESGKMKITPSDKSKILLSCYDTRARCGDYESFCLALEWNRPIEKQFYIPRMRIFKKFGLIQAFQDVIDGELDFLCINMPP